MSPPSRPPIPSVSPSPTSSITVCHNNTPNVIIDRQVYKVFVISSFKKGSRISTKDKNVNAPFVNTGVITMEFTQRDLDMMEIALCHAGFRKGIVEELIKQIIRYHERDMDVNGTVQKGNSQRTYKMLGGI